MARYDYKILNALLASYETSLLARGENKVSVRIQYVFSKKNLPEYYNESSLEYEEIHASMKELEQKGFLSIIWKQGKKDYIIEKVFLNVTRLGDVYQYVKRVPKKEHEASSLKMLEELEQKYDSPIARTFIHYLMDRIRAGKSVKEYIELSEHEKTEELVKAVYCVETNQKNCYIREFSIRCFHDSKVFENMLGKITKIWKQFGKENDFDQIDSVLAEHFIYSTPNYVYIKGSAMLETGKQQMDLEGLSQGIGLSGEDISSVAVFGKKNTKKVITIENLTTFFSWGEKDSIIIYLGGYHNFSRRRLLQMLYNNLPDAVYLHFGDIDVGGFEIYEDLCKKTGIPFSVCHMDVNTLEKNKNYAKPLTEHDKKRLEHLLCYANENHREYAEVLAYMQKYGIKLEQECIEI